MASTPPTDVDRWIGRSVRRARRAQGLNLDDVSLGYYAATGERFGTNRASKVERGETKLLAREAITLAAVLGCGIEDLLAPPAAPVVWDPEAA